MPTQPLSILIAQINVTVGAIETNAEKIIAIIQAQQHQHDVIIFPELALTGYPPEDLIFRHQFAHRVTQALNTIMAMTTHCFVMVGHTRLEDQRCYNTVSVFYQGQCVTSYDKQKLPNYGIFDEARYFTPGLPTPCSLTIQGYRIGLLICEDIWQEGPAEQLLATKVDILFCLNASPFTYDKDERRLNTVLPYAQRGVTVCYVNLVGGQDELIFDGQSFVIDSQGMLCARAPAFQESLQTVTIIDKTVTGQITAALSHEALIYQALVCGLRDYIEKNSFPGVLIGLSGGIDSALVLAIAVDALGAARVHAVMMPSRYTADISEQDAAKQIATLGVTATQLSIEPAFQTLLTTLQPTFQHLPPDITEENMQARIRGLLLMALSNKLGYLVLPTSNKSETAVGYATLYGDMCGGFAVLKDIYKTLVYQLAHYRNSLTPVIPPRVLTRAPTAELAPNQTDQDSLPDYATLDAILKLYIEERLDASDLIAFGYPADIVSKIIHLVKKNEYKRRQAAVGVKITPCAFGRDWRYPITSGY